MCRREPNDHGELGGLSQQRADPTRVHVRGLGRVTAADVVEPCRRARRASRSSSTIRTRREARSFTGSSPVSIHRRPRCRKGGELPQGAVAVKNMKGTAGYMGPCPPSGRHRYRFNVYALDRSAGSPQTRAAFEAAIQGHVLAHGLLVGTYQKIAIAIAAKATLRESRARRAPRRRAQRRVPRRSRCTSTTTGLHGRDARGPRDESAEIREHQATRKHPEDVCQTRFHSGTWASASA